MMKVNCILKDCKSVFESKDAPSPKGVRYICSRHTDDELRAAGIPVSKRTDQDVHFQITAFDPKLNGRTTIEGGENAKRSNGHWMHPLPEKPDLYKSSLKVDMDGE